MATWSEVNFSDLTNDIRIDAEHYRPECLALEQRIILLPHAHLSSIAEVSDGNHISIAEQFTENGVRYLRGQDLSDFFISDVAPIFIPENIYNMLNRSHMRAGDVLLGIVATIGTVSLVTERFGKLTGNCKMAIVRPKKVESEFLSAFFLSKLGQLEINRWVRGTVQTGLILPDLKNLSIPLISDDIRKSITVIVRAAYAKKQEAGRDYSFAESALNSALGLDRVDLAPRLYYEDRFFRVAAAGRCDAEYYQPAKWNVLRALAEMKGSPISEHFRSVRQLWQPDRQPSTYEVRNYDLTDALSPFLDDTKPVTTSSEISSTKKVVKPGDLVVSRLRSYLKEIAVVLPSGGAPLVGSTEFIVLRPHRTSISPEALLVFLRSPYVQTILKWCQDGSNHPRFDEKELLAIRVPPVIHDIQDKLEQKVKQAITARQESRRLLETAKCAVDIAIEDGEVAARNYLNKH